MSSLSLLKHCHDVAGSAKPIQRVARCSLNLLRQQPCCCMDDCFFYAGEADVAKALVVKGR